MIVVDSLSKEIVEKYRMRTVQGLMRDGVDSPRSYLGHTGSVTVVTHNVLAPIGIAPGRAVRAARADRCRVRLRTAPGRRGRVSRA